MGGHKFRLSKIIPISWFYKLRNMNQNLNKHPFSSSSSSSKSSSSLRLRATTSSSSSSSTLSLSSTSSSSLSVPQHTHLSHNRTSQYFKRDLIKFQNSPHTHIPQFSNTQLPNSRSRGNRVSSPKKNHVITPTHDSKSLKDSNFGGKFLDLPLELPPIVTKKKPRSNSEKEIKTQDGTSLKNMNLSVRRLSSVSSSPRMKRRNQCRRRSTSRLSESLAVVKSSVNPQKDFMESMVEMIVENEIKGSKDLEDLLACYLQLNSDEYHQLIIDVFKQIWFTVVADTRLKEKEKKKK